MELEKGTEIHLKAGDVLVDAKPATAGGKVLSAFG